MRNFLLGVVLVCVTSCIVYGQEETLPVRGLKLAAPTPEEIPSFVKFIRKDLSKHNVNHLVLRINYRYKFKGHPEIREKNPLGFEDIKTILKACGESGIQLIPLINCLGHQSWGKDTSKISALLRVYPEFEENPASKINDEDFYCRSYCPRHPQVHKVLFALIDELAEVFETDAVHVGMDEVFVIGEEDCPRCKGRDKAELFAGEVYALYNHLASSGLKMWMWGDRLLDGNTTGLGKWQASNNGTHRAIDMIPKEVVICDWHYKEAPPTASYFATKGFDVIPCSYFNAEVALEQMKEIKAVRANVPSGIGLHMLGVMHTVWGGTGDFLNAYYGKESSEKAKQAANCFKELFK